MEHTYFCEKEDGSTQWVEYRKTKPKMGQVITAYGDKWQVWYIEELPSGRYNARLERYRP